MLIVGPVSSLGGGGVELARKHAGIEKRVIQGGGEKSSRGNRREMNGHYCTAKENIKRTYIMGGIY